MSEARIIVRLDADIRQRLAKQALATGKNESELVREALDAYLQDQQEPEDCLELARRHALMGCGNELPPDLSTNRDHIEGFASEEDCFDYKLEHDPRFLQRIAKARASLEAGEGVRIEDVDGTTKAVPRRGRRSR